MGMTGNPNSPPENVVRPIPHRDPRRRYAWRRLAVWCLISFVLFEVSARRCFGGFLFPRNGAKTE